MKRKVGRIYFIADGRWKTYEFVKIGHTDESVPKRLAALQTGNPKRLFLIGVQPGAREDERQLQGRFFYWRVHGGGGEWFRRNDELDDYLREIRKKHRLPILRARKGGLGDHLLQTRLPIPLYERIVTDARKKGVSVSARIAWVLGQSLLPPN